MEKRKIYLKDIRKHLDRAATKATVHSETHTPGAGLIREAVFGFNDGLVTVLALAAGVAGAISENRIIILAAVAAAVASSISMSLAAYISTKSQVEYYKSEVERERKEIKEDPEYEKAELAELYRRKGFTEKEINMLIKRISSDKELFLKVMLSEELHLEQERFESPYKSGLVMGIATMAGSFIPIIPFFFMQHPAALAVSAAIGISALFAVGALKTKFTERNWLKSGLENMAIGIVATGVSYVLGNFAGSI